MGVFKGSSPLYWYIFCCVRLRGVNMNDREIIEYINRLENAFIDVLYGDSRWHDIQYMTGLSEKRCKELESLFNEITLRDRAVVSSSVS